MKKQYTLYSVLHVKWKVYILQHLREYFSTYSSKHDNID